MGNQEIVSFRDCISSYESLSDDAMAALEEISELVTFKKNTRLITQDKIQNDIFLLGSGLARIFYETTDRQITLDFVSPGGILMSINSYTLKTAGYENIDLLENAVLYKIDHIQLFNLFQTNIEIANWGRKMAELEFIKAEERAMSKLFNTAQERYKELLEKYPLYIQRIKLGYIASYLGVSQVTLSRIRANI